MQQGETTFQIILGSVIQQRHHFSDGIIMTGGESRGRRKGLANIIVERNAALTATEEAFVAENPEPGDENA